MKKSRNIGWNIYTCIRKCDILYKVVFETMFNKSQRTECEVKYEL